MNRVAGQRPLPYHSFILTLWAEVGAQPEGPPVWRASLEDPRQPGRRGFQDISELMRFLEMWTASPERD